MMARVLSDEQVQELRLWARGLETDERPEIRAAARAISLLAAELEAARSQFVEERLVTEALEARELGQRSATATAAEHPLTRDLRGRLSARLMLRRPSQAPR